MSYLARSICIFYKNEKWAKELFNKIRKDVPTKFIQEEYNNWIAFADGTTVQMVCADKYRCRGLRAYEAYIQEGIDENAYYTIIAPCIYSPLGNALVIDKVEDFNGFEFINTVADESYWNKRRDKTNSTMETALNIDFYDNKYVCNVIRKNSIGCVSSNTIKGIADQLLVNGVIRNSTCTMDIRNYRVLLANILEANGVTVNRIKNSRGDLLMIE